MLFRMTGRYRPSFSSSPHHHSAIGSAMSDHRRPHRDRCAAAMVGLLLCGSTLLVGGFAAASASAAATEASGTPVTIAAVSNAVPASAGTQNFILPFGTADAAVGQQGNVAGPLTGIAS